jgi:hypothetical protein
MKKLILILTIVTALALITTACNFSLTRPVATQVPQPQPPIPAGTTVLIDQIVTVPGGGGFVEVSFNASNGQRIQILLSAANPSMQPYGSLQYPNGTSADIPPINTVANGVNTVEIVLNQTGQYSLTVFDGSNQGGAVSVKIVVVQSPQSPTLQVPPTLQVLQPQPPTPAGSTVLIDQMVMVPGGGGFVEVSFHASNGQRIQILLSAADPSVQPNISLQNPNGTTADIPPINTVANGVNMVEVILNQTGQYSLTVFDGSNKGGAVSVKIVVMN